MSVRITVLSDNTVKSPGLLGEHGLSFLIESGDESLLLDTGEGYVLRHNADKLKVDLERVGKVVLSHGHYDHTGGLKAVLASGSGKAVFGHPDMFGKKVALLKGKRLAIGIPHRREELEQLGATFHLSKDPVEVAHGIVTTGQVPRVTDFEEVDKTLHVEEGGEIVRDELHDDLSLILDSPQGLVLLLGCCHTGVINTLWRAINLTGKRRFAAVIGGMHLMSAGEKQLTQTIHTLRSFEIDRIFPCHCTGAKASIRLWNALGEDRVYFAGVGDRWTFE